MVYPPTGSTAYEREMSTPPTLLRSVALLYLYLYSTIGEQSYSLPETHTRKIRYKTACHTRQKPVPVFCYRFLAPISDKVIIIIIIIIIINNVLIKVTLSSQRH